MAYLGLSEKFPERLAEIEWLLKAAACLPLTGSRFLRIEVAVILVFDLGGALLLWRLLLRCLLRFRG